MADGAFSVVVVTPEARLVEARARAVVLRSSDGDLTVLDGHTPLVTDITPGEVRIDPDEGAALRIAVHGGYLQVETVAGSEDGGQRATRVTVLAGVAERAEEIDVARARTARQQAEARAEELRSGGRTAAGSGGAGEEDASSPEALELAEAEGALRRAELRLAVAGAES